MAVQDLGGTRMDEISDNIFRLSVPVASIAGGGITYNQYLLLDDEPLLFHTGKRAMFSQVQTSISRICHWNACAGSLSRISKPTNVVPLTTSLPLLRTRSRYVAAFSQCCR
jgi:hypothetical protein